MTSLAWKINRLRLMNPAEIGWRVSSQTRVHLAKFGLGLAHHVPAPAHADAFGAPFIRVPDDADRASTVKAADRILAGRWSVFALREAELGFPPQWNRDPKTGTIAPLAFGQAIDYRDEKIVGDIKYLWEPSRHLELVALAQAYALTRESRYLEACGTFVTSWLDQCPYPKGVHWTSSLELAVRLLNWSVAWQLFGGPRSALFAGEAGRSLKARWLDSIYRHVHFISRHLSAHSSANNHLFGEYMGMYIAANTWPAWPEMDTWRAVAQRGLEAEALRQNAPDGVNLEQAVYYQHEVMDMMVLTLLSARSQGTDFSAPYANRLETLAEFLHAITDVAGHVPMIGDADDALMVRLDHTESFDPYRSLLASCAMLFERADFRAKAGRLDEKSKWLFGTDSTRRWQTAAAAARAPRMEFPHGGYFLLGADLDTPSEIRAVIDCAPLGYLSIAAHGHADALSIVLSAGGSELLIDPGTYAYHTQKVWRDYFRGTLAHNTVRIDGQDQSEIGGNFMWLAKARSRAIAHQPTGLRQRFVGEHDGYRRLPDPVVHRRSISFDISTSTLEIVDELECRGAHVVEIPWHWHEDADVIVDSTDQGVEARHGLSTARLRCEHPGFTCSRHRGDENPILGWVSRRFDEKLPTTCTLFTGRIEGRARIVTTIRVSPPGQS